MSTALTILPSRLPTLPSANEWQTMVGMAEALYRSGLLPTHIRSPQAAIAVVQKGRELGIPPMYALCNIVVVQGKPTCSAELMLALIYRDQGDDAIRFLETTSKLCRVAYKRRGWSKPTEFAFAIEDAQLAGLLTGKPDAAWTKYPQAMLRARAISAVARLAFPDTIAGMYTPEEVGAEVATVSAEGEIEYVPPAVPPEPTAPTAQTATERNGNARPEFTIDLASSAGCQAFILKDDRRINCPKPSAPHNALQGAIAAGIVPSGARLCAGHLSRIVTSHTKPEVVGEPAPPPDAAPTPGDDFLEESGAF